METLCHCLFSVEFMLANALSISLSIELVSVSGTTQNPISASEELFFFKVSVGVLSGLDSSEDNLFVASSPGMGKLFPCQMGDQAITSVADGNRTIN